jgi:flagellar biosynthesis protein FlhF
VQPDIAAEFIAHIKRLPGYDPLLGLRQLRPHAGAVLQDMGLRRAVDPAAESGTARTVALVGPAGVGKTTTAVKLTAVEALGKGRRVALMTLDDQRIGAIEQLRIYAGILGVPLAVASSVADARRELKGLSAMDVIVIDTPGVSPGEEKRRGELRQILEALKCRQIHLVLSACRRESDLRQAIEAWKKVPVSGLAFTRLDEAGTCGSILNLLIHSRLPLSYLSTGPQIPEDLADKPVELLVSRLWPAADVDEWREAPGGRPRTAPTAAAASARFVANRNSDLYHRADCKWARRIKSDHGVQFASPAEAESRRFLACRDCRPDLTELSEADPALRDGVRLSGYR